MTPATRLAAYLDLPECDGGLRATFAAYSNEREKLLQVFAFLALMESVAEIENASSTLIFIEAMLFNVWWVDRFIGHADCLEPCRKKLSEALWVFTDDCKHSYAKDPNLCIWAVVRSLIVERNARSQGLTKWRQSKQIAMLDRVIADCQAHLERGLPRDLADRLRILESHGVFFPSDIYPAVAESLARRR